MTQHMKDSAYAAFVERTEQERDDLIGLTNAIIAAWKAQGWDHPSFSLAYKTAAKLLGVPLHALGVC